MIQRKSVVHILEATTGGIRKHVVDLLLHLDKSKFDITLIYSFKRADAIFQADLQRLSGSGVGLVELHMAPGIKPMADVRALFTLVRRLDMLQPSILHLHGAKAGALGRIAAFLTGIDNVVYTPHGGSFHRLSGVAGKLFLFIERVLSLHTRYYIGVSEFSRKQIIDSIPSAVTRVKLIYNGIDLDEIDSKKRQCSLGVCPRNSFS